ncbi:proton-conducting transporter membrane subunit [Cellulomonas sp. KRMCY2]|uniref:proton-conducting transporter transmembrane domain-containing protein n=1 Tax=Cellulomonas sp. KRMCY2 TaxID=1304865 RepID=UPI00045EB50F|nr:proton-conducting transporter membrane subunit [Cellulomonas sp. KRMCY2]
MPFEELVRVAAGSDPVAAAVLLVPLLAPMLVAVAAVVVGWRPAVAWSTVAASVAILGSGVVAAVATSDGSELTVGGMLRVDALSAVMLLVIGVVAVVATWSGVGYIDHEIAAEHTDARGAQRYGLLVPLFLTAMVLAVEASNLGVLWAAVEATTIVTAFLVGHRGGRAAVEATWKYVIICSVGIALAYLGTVLVYYASQHTGTGEAGSLDWTVLVAQADQLDPGVMRIAVPLLVLGFGTKVGLVPMHSWLPDAHSQAPAPVSALMSGVLLSVAVYALLRYRVIAVAALDGEFVRNLLLVVGLASVALAASLLLAQRDYKRLLAYSSIEHMGLVIIGVAIGTPLAVAALLLHILGHGLAKAVLFCASGQILASEGTTRIADVRGLLARRPVLAGSFALGLAALLGLPPFSLFVSELALARAAADAGVFWAVAVALVLLLVVFVAIAGHAAGMLFGAAPSGLATAAPTSTRAAAAPLVTGLIALAILGVVAWPLDVLLHAASIIAGTS